MYLLGETVLFFKADYLKVTIAFSQQVSKYAHLNSSYLIIWSCVPLKTYWLSPLLDYKAGIVL